MTQQESDVLMGWAKAHSGVYAMTKLAPNDEAVRAAASEAWNAIQRVDDAVRAALGIKGTSRVNFYRVDNGPYPDEVRYADGWYWRDESCEGPMGPFGTRAEAVVDHHECRSVSSSEERSNG